MAAISIADFGCFSSLSVLMWTPAGAADGAAARGATAGSVTTDEKGVQIGEIDFEAPQNVVQDSASHFGIKRFQRGNKRLNRINFRVEFVSHVRMVVEMNERFKFVPE